MTIQTNLYVEKANSEHPIAVWMLNEQVDYISLITETQRSYSGWTATSGAITSESTKPVTTPFLSSAVSQILPTSTSVSKITLTNNSTIGISSFNTDLSNFAISGNLYIDSAKITLIEFGYKYTLSSVVTEILQTKLVSVKDQGTWVYFGGTFDNPPVGSTNITVLIKITLAASVVGDTTLTYRTLLNGVTVGQWSEEFNRVSLGLQMSDYSTEPSLSSSLKVIPAYPYGTSNKNAYYTCNTTSLYSKNFGVPIVYGSSNVTKLYPNTDAPSLVFPGYGFLNTKGKYNEYTAEMWIKLYCSLYNGTITQDQTRI